MTTINLRRMNANRSTHRDPVEKPREPLVIDIVEVSVALQVVRNAYEYAAMNAICKADVLRVLTEYSDKLESGEEIVTYIDPNR